MTVVKDRLPRAVIFDLDGTLVDSVWDLMAGLNWLLDGLGRRQVARDEVVKMVGDGVPKLVERALIATGDLPATDDLAALIARFTDHYEANAAVLTKPYPGAVAALKALQQAGVRLGVCTNKPAVATAEVLDTLGLASYFASVAGGDTVPGFRKPAPEHVLHVLKELDVKSSEAVMIGDSHNDVNAAKNAGVSAIAVTFGYAHGPVEDLPADAFIDHFDDLIPALKTLARAQ